MSGVNIPKDSAVRSEAEERVVRAKRYAVMFPHLIGGSDLKFQDTDWQEDYLRRMYKLPPLTRETVIVNNEEKKVNKVVDVNSRKEYMRRYMAKKRAAKRGEIPCDKA